MESLQVGDLCVSIKGHDKGNVFLVVSIDKTRAQIVDGKKRKVLSPKTKNIKHLVRIEGRSMENTASKIQKGIATSNEKLYKALNAQIKEKGE